MLCIQPKKKKKKKKKAEWNNGMKMGRMRSGQCEEQQSNRKNDNRSQRYLTAVLHNSTSTFHILSVGRFCVFLALALQTLYPDFLSASTMPPPKKLEFHGVDNFIFNSPLPITDGDRRVRVRKMEVRQVDLRRRILGCWRFCHQR